MNRVLEQSMFKTDGWCEDDESKNTGAIDMICLLVSAQHYPDLLAIVGIHSVKLE